MLFRSEVLAQHTPTFDSLFDQVGSLHFNDYVEAVAWAQDFAAQSGKFDSALKQNYELQPENLTIGAMLGDTRRPLDYASRLDYYRSRLFSNSGRYTTNILDFSKAIIANLPAAKPYTYVEPGVSSNLSGQLNAGQSWAGATRDWSANAQT